jgi:hypothetical protein
VPARAKVEWFIFDSIDFANKGNNTSHPKIISSEQYENGKYPIRKKGDMMLIHFRTLMEFRFVVSEILINIMI